MMRDELSRRFWQPIALQQLASEPKPLAHTAQPLLRYLIWFLGSSDQVSCPTQLFVGQQELYLEDICDMYKIRHQKTTCVA